MQPTRIALAAALSALAFGQSGARIMSGSASSNGVGFYFETRLEPPVPPLAAGLGGGVEDGNGATHRYMVDRTQHKYFGYDIQIEALSQANTYQAVFRPLSISTREIDPDNPARWSLVPLTVYPAPQTLHGGETIALELFTNPATGQKIVDYIRMKGGSRETAYANEGPARDFTVADAEIRLMEPHVSVSGTPVPGTANFTGGVSGSAVWFYIPDRGRYFLSLVPHPEFGFQKAGEIRGSTLTIGGPGTVTIDCNGRIAPGYAPYNLYVLYDAGWRPKNARDSREFIMTAGDNLKRLLHR
jgi:hypothetical protein